MDSRTVDYSRTEQFHLICPADLNGAGRLFGGTLLKWIDEVAGVVAKRHSSIPNITTATIDNLQFKTGTYCGDLLVLIGYVTYVGTSSMEVRIDTYIEDSKGMRVPVNRAYFVMVALDNEGHPIKVPGLSIHTESEKAEWEGGILRKKLRLERRERGY